MPDYVPLCSAKRDLLPGPCQVCAWWQTAGIGRVPPASAGTIRERWTSSVATTWGNPGLVQIMSASRRRAGEHSGAPDGDNSIIHFAPAASLPRLRDLLFTPLPPGTIFLFCLGSTPAGRPEARPLLHEALRQLRQRRVREVYAFASADGGSPGEEHCEFFSRRFLQANGFGEVHGCSDLFLMRADLRGLLSVLAPLETALRRLLREEEPTPSPAAWMSRWPS